MVDYGTRPSRTLKADPHPERWHAALQADLEDEQEADGEDIELDRDLDDVLGRDARGGT